MIYAIRAAGLATFFYFTKCASDAHVNRLIQMPQTFPKLEIPISACYSIKFTGNPG